ncbi:MAG: hypothetical protein HYT43_01550 [Candidatus Taylorbacteria bacterium]|nr:hypothetical protein [Candidatus Taylorbacteria bacterium]
MKKAVEARKEREKTRTGKRKSLVLIDAHAVLHRAYHALPEFVSSKGEPTGALYGLSAMLIKIIQDLKPDYIAACYDLPGGTFRHEAYDGYKAHRGKAPDDLISQLRRSREIFRAFSIPIYEMPGFEADDILGTIVERLKEKAGVDIIIASGDMDTLQLVRDKQVRVYTLKKGLQDTILYDEDKVRERFGFGPELLPDYKGLRGDPSDNIIGVPGIGEKTATHLIQRFGSIEEIHNTLKENKQKLLEAEVKPRIVELLAGHEEEALFSKALATIRRDAPIIFELPEEEWRRSLDLAAVEKLFAELEFRALAERARQTFFGAPEAGGAETPLRQSSLNQSGAPLIPERELRETAVALWLLNSSIVSPALDDVLRFAKTRDFSKAREIILSALERENLSRLYKEIERPLIGVVEKMGRRGVKIDAKYLETLSVKYHEELSSLEKKIWELAGEEFNINSPKQLGVVLYDKLSLGGGKIKKTAGGARSTRESELLKLKDIHPVIDTILSYRELGKLLSTYIDNIPSLLDADSRLHTTFLQAGTTTGRMASENPNLQNIPIKTELGRAIREAFVVEKNWRLISFDYSQMELRIAAILSGDRVLLEIFRRGEDVHTAVASKVFRVPAEEVDYEMRRRAKVINFGIIYGMGVNALRANLGSDRAAAQEFYNKYFEAFSGLADYLNSVKAAAERKGYTETLFGRRRYFEGINSKVPYIKAAAERMAINAPIQGTGADIVKLAMVRIDEYLKKEGLNDRVYPLLQVHDEIIYEAPEEFVTPVVPKIKEIMENVLTPGESKGIVMVAEAAVGKNWGEMEEI